MRILYAALKYDYGDPSRGYSFEHINFYDTLNRMEKVDVAYFPIDEMLRLKGRKKLNTTLIQTVEKYSPDLCLFVLFTDEISSQTLDYINKNTGAVTVNWFCDDHWRFESFSRYLAPHLQWIVTTDHRAVEKYRKNGHENIILSQWACNHYLFKPSEIERDLDVTFVGQARSDRKKTIHFLGKNKIHIDCWGRGWDNGRLSEHEMILTFSRSKINLNFTESSAGFKLKPLVKVFFKRRADNSIVLNSIREMAGSVQLLTKPMRPQIKARNFEIPGAGGFLLTAPAEYLEEYYIPGKEIEIFSNRDDLIDKIRYYLNNDGEREKIRQAGYQRTIREHTFEKRFRDAFRIMGFN